MILAPINSTEVAQMPLPLHPTIDEQDTLLAQLLSAHVHAENLMFTVTRRHGIVAGSNGVRISPLTVTSLNADFSPAMV